MPIVTLQQAKNHLKITHEHENNDIQLKLEQATAIVLMYLKRTDLGSPLDEDSSELTATDLTSLELSVVQAAILKVLANFDRFRGDESDGENPSDEKFLTADIRGVLSMLRDPALA